MQLITNIVLLICCGYSLATQSAYLDPDERFFIEWDYDDTNVTITAKVKTTGWFGLGFSPNGGMAGADIITAGVKDGVPYLQDRYALKNGFPRTDRSQDVHLISGSEVNGETTIKFTRKHNTCDENDFVITEDTMRMIYAISPKDSDDLSYHSSNRGSRSLYLRKTQRLQPNIPADAFTVDFTVKDLAVKPVENRYYCEVIRAPKLDEKHHMIRVEPIITNTSLGIAHHIILYGCYGDDKSKSPESLFTSGKTGRDCFSTAMPEETRHCQTVVAAWAIGGGDLIYPDDAGFAMGKGLSPDYYFLEIHYDNPTLKEGLIDNSGVRLTLTKTLRKYDSAVLTIGSVWGIVIPPRSKSYAYSAFCSGNCTNAVLDEPMKVFGTVLHGHLAARGITARQFRNGQEVRAIDADMKYDFNYQQYKLLDPPIEIQKGDDLMMTCFYNTEDRDDVTYGGQATKDEMCLGFLFYYPASPFASCYTAPEWIGHPAPFFNSRLNFTISPHTRSQEAFSMVTKQDAWTEERVRTLERGHKDYKHYDMCKRRDESKLHFDQGGVPIMYYPPPAVMNPPMTSDSTCPKKPDTIIG